MSVYAAFVRRPAIGQFGRYGRARYLDHVYGYDAQAARDAARRRFRLRTCDHVEVRADGGRRPKYGWFDLAAHQHAMAVRTL